MKRLCLLAALIMFSSSADAGSGISFSIGGHRIHIDSVRCRALSCVSVAAVARRDDGGDKERVQKAPIPVVPAASNPPPAATPRAPLPIIVDKPAPVVPPLAAARPVPSPPPPVAAPAEPAHPASQIVHVSRAPEDEPADGPIGDWQTETDSLVRIRLCGQALCGYALDRTSRDLGEAVLINMKPKQGAQWSGNVYSHDSGSTSYGTIESSGTERLRVATCALGHFYCTTTDWTRVSHAPQRMITQRHAQPDPRS